MDLPEQSPRPGSHVLTHRGSPLTFSLTLPKNQSGSAWLRTNLGHADTLRREIIARVEQDEPLLKRDWHDIPMIESGPGRFHLTLPLLETGRFQAKAFFIPDDDPQRQPRWPQGHDVIVKVEPADYVCGATLYSAFVRQFGENRFRGAEDPAHQSAVESLEAAGYEVIPRSGKFRDLIAQLDHIIGTLGFRVIQLLPIFPTPTTYARMGRFGSPFAALDLMAVDPALAEFDRRTTPLEQFRELLDETHHRGAKLFVDIPINHTGWASWLQNHHPEWFRRREDRGFASPGAWGVTWADLSELDYSHRDLWRYMADVFLFWCRQGVDGFRCDAGYMVPLPVWEYIIAKVRLHYPDTIFLLEGLGGDKRLVFDLLDRANLNWAYSELFQNYTRPDVEAILAESIAVSAAQGVQVHFAETHDNNRLAATSQVYARMRTQLAALCSHSGAFGITCGVEWFAEAKIEVHRAHALGWDNKENLIADLRRLNALLTAHPAFWADAQLTLLPHRGPAVLALHRQAPEGDAVLALVNLDAAAPAEVPWDLVGKKGQTWWDLLSGQSFEVPSGKRDALTLPPGGALCLSPDAAWLEAISDALTPPGKPANAEPAQSLRQRLLAQLYQVHNTLAPSSLATLQEASLEEALSKFSLHPDRYCQDLNPHQGPPPIVRWRWPRDSRRVVLWPRHTLLLLEADHRFLAEIHLDQNVLHRVQSLPGHHGHFALIPRPAALTDHGDHRSLAIHFTAYTPSGAEHHQSEILSLSDSSPSVEMLADKDAVRHRSLYALATNGHGAMAHVRGHWGDLRSQYDALLAANPHPDFPVERRILLTRARAWIVYRGFSREINADCLRSFGQNSQGELFWSFFVPTGMGLHLRFEIALRLSSGSNATRLTFRRVAAGSDAEALADDLAVRLIVRPDIEDRGFHEKTKALWGPEDAWPAAVTPLPNGFDFLPEEGCGLQMRTASSAYVHEPEWQYMVPHPVDASRGLDGASDLFSPGYFTFDLKGAQSVTLDAQLPGESLEDAALQGSPPESCDLLEASRRAISAFIVKRDDSKTVIAGYPWFLDWGRDTLICLRGIIAAGLLEEAQDIVRQFARFEKGGTLPNMIRGDDDSNRDTSDAPLWLFAACADLRRATGNDRFLETDCGRGRSLFQVLQSIARGYLKGTANGISVDRESGLVFSPSHFTWMDTNHPAGTPREGYPIEIQALWHGALAFLESLEPEGPWPDLRQRVAASIERFFWHRERGFLSDCLHAKPSQKPGQATPDDHLRPNQLFAVTLGAVTDPAICQSIVSACEELLIPGAIRSLAERRVWHRLEIRREEALLNNPVFPYWGRYEGDEDTRRKPAYHNGTAWTWPFPSYSEALWLVYGEAAKPLARSLLSSSSRLFNEGCLGQLPEILDGDAPHAQRGCGAQAWGATELYRVLRLLEDENGKSG